MDIAKAAWRLLLGRWRRRSQRFEAGYTVLLPVPGDLPAFTRLALDVAARQKRELCHSIVVISDMRSAAVESIVRDASNTFENLSYVYPRGVVGLVLRSLNDPGRYHGVQLTLGVEAAQTSHIILHDADAILIEPQFFDEQYGAAIPDEVAAVGVHPLWDEELRKIRPDLIATWEMCARSEWLRRFPPYLHLAHKSLVSGRLHVLDTTVHAQLKTNSQKLVLHGSDSDFVHFNYVVSTYRKFQAAAGYFEDSEFRLLFVRALSDALDVGECGDIPTAAELAKGLPGAEMPSERVTYPSDAASHRYADFRSKLEYGLAAIYGAKSGRLLRLVRVMSPFDEFYGFKTNSLRSIG